MFEMIEEAKPSLGEPSLAQLKLAETVDHNTFLSFLKYCGLPPRPYFTSFSPTNNRYLYTDSFKDPKTGNDPTPSESKVLLSLARKCQLPCDPGTSLFRVLHETLVRSATATTTNSPIGKEGNKKNSKKPTKVIRSSYSDDMRMLFDDKTFTDVELVSGDGVRIPCHKFILAARSDVFSAMLSSGMVLLPMCTTPSHISHTLCHTT